MFVKLYLQDVIKKTPIILFKNLFPPLVNSSVCFSQSSLKQNEEKLDNATIRQLETLSLVNLESKEHIIVVEDAIKFADNIHSVNTDNVEPLISVLENEILKLREDIITEGDCRKEILLNAATVEEGYFVAPPGNISIDSKPFHGAPAELNHEQPIHSGSIVSHFTYGPLGELLRQNIHQEWVISNIINRNLNVYPFCNVDDNMDLLTGIKNHYVDANAMNGGSLPFSIAYSRAPIVQKIKDLSSSEESKFFRAQNVSAMKCFTFTTAEDGSRFFHFWLRQRKIWWRKFSANPTRFSQTSIQKIPEKMEFACIQSEFPWGLESVEEVKLYSNNIFEKLAVSEQSIWSIKRSKNKVFPMIIESVTNLDLACFTLLCDAFVEDIRLDTGLPHRVIRLHRKLAPYKVAVLANSRENVEHEEDLMHLAEYVSLILRKIGVATLFLSKEQSKTTEEWFQFYDLMAVPFVVILEPSMLNDSILGLRSRETTLQERLHLSKLPEYMTMLLKNY